jgi:hypothetical protein
MVIKLIAVGFLRLKKYLRDIKPETPRLMVSLSYPSVHPPFAYTLEFHPQKM